MKEKFYKFKHVKHSVLMRIVKVTDEGKYILENKDYKGLVYVAYPEELEEVK